MNKAAQTLSKLAFKKQFGGKTKAEIAEHMKKVRAGIKLKAPKQPNK